METMFFENPALILLENKIEMYYNNKQNNENSVAFGQIAQLYSDATPQSKLLAKLVLGNDFYIRHTH
jgi:hypothetical protein